MRANVYILGESPYGVHPPLYTPDVESVVLEPPGGEAIMALQTDGLGAIVFLGAGAEQARARSSLANANDDRAAVARAEQAVEAATRDPLLSALLVSLGITEPPSLPETGPELGSE